MMGLREGVLPGPMVGTSPLFSLLVLTCLQGEGPLKVSGFGVLVLPLIGGGGAFCTAVSNQDLANGAIYRIHLPWLICSILLICVWECLCG